MSPSAGRRARVHGRPGGPPAGGVAPRAPPWVFTHHKATASGFHPFQKRRCLGFSPLDRPRLHPFRDRDSVPEKRHRGDRIAVGSSPGPHGDRIARWVPPCLGYPPSVRRPSTLLPAGSRRLIVLCPLLATFVKPQSAMGTSHGGWRAASHRAAPHSRVSWRARRHHICRCGGCAAQRRPCSAARSSPRSSHGAASSRYSSLVASGEPGVIVYAAVERPVPRHVGPLTPTVARLLIVTVDSCIVLLILNGVLLAIDDAAVGAPAVLCVALPLQLPLHSYARLGGQLHRAARPPRGNPRHRRCRCQYSGRSSCRAASPAASPLLGS